MSKENVTDLLSFSITAYTWYKYIIPDNKVDVEKLNVPFIFDVIFRIGFIFFITIALYIGVRNIIKGIVNIFWRK